MSHLLYSSLRPARARWHALAAVLLALALPLTGQAQSAAAPVTLRISSVAPSVMPVDFRAGIAQGIYRKHGLDIQVTELATGTENITAAVQGSADIAYADLFAGLAAVANGFEIGLVSPHNTTSPKNYILVRDDSPIRDTKDLVGKTIAIGAPPQFRALTSAALAAHGVDPKQVSYTIVRDQTTFGTVLKGKQVDAISTSSAVNAHRWVHDYQFRVISADNRALGIAKDSPIAGWWVTRAWYDKNPKLAAAFHAANQETLRWFASLSEEQRAAHVKAFAKLDLKELERQAPGVLSAATETFGFIGPVTPAPLVRYISLGRQYAKVPDTLEFERYVLPPARGASAL